MNNDRRCNSYRTAHNITSRENSFNDSPRRTSTDASTQNDVNNLQMQQHHYHDDKEIYPGEDKSSDPFSPFKEESPSSFAWAPIDLYPQYISNSRNRKKSLTGFDDQSRSRANAAFSDLNGWNGTHYYSNPFHRYSDQSYPSFHSAEDKNGFHLGNSREFFDSGKIHEPPTLSTSSIPNGSTNQSQIKENSSFSVYNTSYTAFQDVSLESKPLVQRINEVHSSQNLLFSGYAYDNNARRDVKESADYNRDNTESDYTLLEGEDSNNHLNHLMSIRGTRKRKRKDDTDEVVSYIEPLQTPFYIENENQNNEKILNFKSKLVEYQQQIKKEKANTEQARINRQDTVNGSDSLRNFNRKASFLMSRSKSVVRKLIVVSWPLPLHPSELMTVGWLSNGDTDRKELMEYYNKLEDVVKVTDIDDREVHKIKRICMNKQVKTEQDSMFTCHESNGKVVKDDKEATQPIENGYEVSRMKSTTQEKNKDQNHENKILCDNVEKGHLLNSTGRFSNFIDLTDQQIQYKKNQEEEASSAVVSRKENRKKIDVSSSSDERKDFVKKDDLESKHLGPSTRATPSLYNTICRYDVFCTRNDCKFRHPPWAKRNGSGANTFVNSKTKSTQDIHVRLTTWNTLASPLAIAMKKNGKYDEKVLDEEPRTTLLLSELRKKMRLKKNYQGGNALKNILCLQEVTQDLARGKLNKLCVENKYMSFFSPYGTISNGFMGNMILVPAETYTIINSIDFVVSEYTELPVAKGYPNIMQIAILSEKKSSKIFMVANYHMPCQWQNPIVMTEHVKACIYLLQHYNLPILFAGDFNFTPKDNHYSLTCKDFEGIWNNDLVEEVEKRLEPSSSNATLKEKGETTIKNFPIEDTTYSFVKAEFRGCIDHIFYNRDKLKLLSVDPLEKLINIIPDRFHPSDHLPVSAVFSLDTNL